MPTLSPQTPLITKPLIHEPGNDGTHWKTTLFNCNCHTFEEVIAQVMKAINCSLATARNLANMAHHTGHVKVCEGSRDYCETVADTLSSIGLRASATD
jgi:ATP-dependent Clp protease adapter protein ClpS